MIKKRYTRQEMLDGIRNRDNLISKYIYHTHWNNMTGFICKMGGAEEDAKDVFQEILHSSA